MHKVVGLVGGGSVINGAYPVYLISAEAVWRTAPASLGLVMSYREQCKISWRLCKDNLITGQYKSFGGIV